MELSIFKGWTDETPVSISLDAIVEMMRTDASLKDLTDKHRYYLSIGQKSNAKYYKQRMSCFAVAVRFEGGKAKDNIAAWTGLTIVDLDNIAPNEMTRALDLIRKDPHTLLTYTTISGNGIRVISRYAFNVNDNDNVNENNTTSPLQDTPPNLGGEINLPDGNCPPRLGGRAEERSDRAEGVYSKLHTLTTQRSESNICLHNIAEQASGLKCETFINSKQKTAML